MLFLTNPLHYALHHDLRWRLATRFPFAAKDGAISLARGEVNALARHLLIVIQTVADRRQVVALLRSSIYTTPALSPEGTWNRGPVPLLLRYHPFSIIQDASSPGRFVLGVIANPDCLDKQEGELFFDHLARPLPRVIAIQRRLGQIANEQKQINAAAEKLYELGALSAIDVRDPLGRKVYSTVDLSVLATLAGSEIAKLSSRPQDILQLAAALDLSATVHLRSQARVEPELRPFLETVEHRSPADPPPQSAKDVFLINDDLEMRF